MTIRAVCRMTPNERMATAEVKIQLIEYQYRTTKLRERRIEDAISLCFMREREDGHIVAIDDVCDLADWSLKSRPMGPMGQTDRSDVTISCSLFAVCHCTSSSTQLEDCLPCALLGTMARHHIYFILFYLTPESAATCMDGGLIKYNSAVCCTQKQKINRELMGYKLFYGQNHEARESEEIEVGPANVHSYTLMDLKMFTLLSLYNISVLAFNPAGDGPRWLFLEIRTDPGKGMSFGLLEKSAFYGDYDEFDESELKRVSTDLFGAVMKHVLRTHLGDKAICASKPNERIDFR
uniref:Uncharacterized protein n=1 Tax=Strigamia maritima TaxID=126957 RepID=T1J1G1_STRMM